MILGLLLSAIVPVVIIILYVYVKDKYEKEPKFLLFVHFVLGAILSVIISIGLYLLSDIVIPLNGHSIFVEFVKAFLIVGIIEEFSKYVVIRYVAQPNQNFNEPFDGIVYAIMVGMGFAATENIIYVINGGYEVAVVRAFTAVPAHATFAILMGYYMGKAKFSSNRSLLNLTGLLLAVLFHGAYDFFLFIDYIPGIWIGAFISLLIGIILSHRAIKNHQEASHFKDMES